MKRKLLGVLVALPMIMGGLSTGALGAATETEHLKNQTETMIDILPCVGGRAEITITYNAVFHTTETSNGIHSTGTIAGTVVADPLRAGVPTYRGHFTQWFGENVNRNASNACFTFNVSLRANDGSTVRFHENAHFIANNSGVELFFDKMHCR